MVGSQEMAERAFNENDAENYSAGDGWEYVGSGAWRSVFAHPSDPNVVYKIMHDSATDKRGDVWGSNTQEAANAAYFADLPYIPEVTLYHVGDRTVNAIPRFLPIPYPRYGTPEYDEYRKMTRKIEQETGIGDVKEANLGMDNSGNVFLIDLGVTSSVREPNPYTDSSDSDFFFKSSCQCSECKPRFSACDCAMCQDSL